MYAPALASATAASRTAHVAQRVRLARDLAACRWCVAGAAALSYARRGWHVLPLTPKGKRPLAALAPHGVKDATTDVEPIAEWWRERPDANVGIATGAGLVVLDVDGPEGEASLAALADKHGPLPTTLEARTGRGRHLYFSAPDGVDIRNSAGKLGAKLDVRGCGGYVVAPPSRHESGSRYEWSDASTPLAPLPEWLVALLIAKAPKSEPKAAQAPERKPLAPEDSRARAYARAALDRELIALSQADDGQRNATLNRAAFSAGQFIGAGALDEDEARAELAKAARRIGLERDEIARTIESGIAAGKKEPRELPTDGNGTAKIADDDDDDSRNDDDAPARVEAVARIDGPAIFEPLPPVLWVCEGIELAAGAPTLLAGYGYTGKTTLAQDLALAVASGGRAWEAFPVERGRVVHIDYEQGERLTRERYQRLARARGFNGAAVGDRLSLIVQPTLYIDSDGAEAWLCCELDGANLVVIDSFRAAAPRTEENSSVARVPLDMLGRVSARTGCAVLVIHHARKPSSENDYADVARYAVRGSSAVFDACQAVLVASPAFEGNDNALPRPPQLALVKARLTGREARPMTFAIDDVRSGDDPRAGLAVSVTLPSRAKTLGDRIVATLRAAKEPLTKNAVREKLSRSDAAIDAELAALLGETPPRVRRVTTTVNGRERAVFEVIR